MTHLSKSIIYKLKRHLQEEQSSVSPCFVCNLVKIPFRSRYFIGKSVVEIDGL